MRRYLLLCFTSFLYLITCSPIESDKTYLDYSDFSEKHIQWSELFDQKSDSYFVYIYSSNCGHCVNIKQDVLGRIDSKNIYLIHFDEAIQTSPCIETTIGANTIEDVYIMGVPTLLYLENKIISKNVCGIDDVLSLLYS